VRAKLYAEEHGWTLGKYLKDVLLALYKENPFTLILRYQKHSVVLQHLEQEARRIEMPVEDYIQALLADRDRELYGGGKSLRPAHLWYAQGYQPSGGVVKEEQEQQSTGDDFDLDAAFSNVEAFFGTMKR
jgi:hypothetical protein